MGHTTSVPADLEDVDRLQYLLQRFLDRDDRSVAIYEVLLIAPITSTEHKAMSSISDALDLLVEGVSTEKSSEAALPLNTEASSTQQSTETMTDQQQTTGTTHIQQPRSILCLPAELLDMVASRLDYPDLLSLKLTHPKFLHTFNTVPTVRQRVSWVLHRNGQYLPIPHNRQLSFRSDKAFVTSREVNDILRRRRLHIECLKCQPARELAIARFGKKRGKTICFVTGRACPKVVDRENQKGQYYVRALTRGVFGRPATTTSFGWMANELEAITFGLVLLVVALVLYYVVPNA